VYYITEYALSSRVEYKIVYYKTAKKEGTKLFSCIMWRGPSRGAKSPHVHNAQTYTVFSRELKDRLRCVFRKIKSEPSAKFHKQNVGGRMHRT
jgi:hypothetical protein